METRQSLRRRMLLGLLAYALLSSVVVFAYGYMVNERSERAVWKTLLDSEFNHLLRNRPGAPGFHRWVDTDLLSLYGGATSRPIPEDLAQRPDGLHDEVEVAGKSSVVLLRRAEGLRWALVLDISDLERHEIYFVATVLTAMLAMVVALGIVIGLGVDRLVRPMREVAVRIAELRPDRGIERIEVEATASREVAIIADALNDYLRRNALFVERERAFINSASHELRTPISVIAGAAELASAQPGMPATALHQLARIRRTSHEIERLIALLLVLAKDPQRLVDAGDRISLDQLLPEIVEDYRPIAQEKGLVLSLTSPPATEIIAPMPVVQAAIGNLLRNAIENSDSGVIDIRLEPGAAVEIADPGHGMTPEELSAIHTRMARGGGHDGAGIGLQLIARLCAHLGWTLDIASAPEHGTTARLEFRRSAM